MATVSWVKEIAPINTAYLESVPSIAIDSSNNVYIAYATRGSVSGGTAFALNTTSDIVVCKLNSSGVVQWIKQQGPGMSTNSTDSVPYIAVNSSFVYVAYQTSSIVSGGTFMGGTDVVLFCMNTSGTMQWIRQTNVFNTTVAEVSPTIAIDSSSNAYVALQTAGTVSTGTSSGGTDIAIIKYNSSGTLLWVRQLTGTNTASADSVPYIALDSSANIYVTYQSSGTTSGGVFIGGTDVVVFKMDTNGNFIWVRQQGVMNTTLADTNPVLDVDLGGNVYVTYATTGAITGGSNVGSTDIVVFKMNSSGSLIWIKQHGNIMNTNLAETFPYITVDGYENIYVSYITLGSVSGGSGLVGSTDVVIVKLNNQGAVQWSNQSSRFNSTLAESGPCVIKSDLTGNLHFTYATTGTVSGGTNLGGAGDIVVTKLTQTTPTATVPAAPTGVTAVQTSTLSADVSWTGPTNSNNAVVRSYTVTSSPGGFSTIVDGSLRTATVTGLSGAGTNYTFTVVATNTSGNSAASAASTAIPIYTGPDPPTNVTGVSGNTQVTVSWTPPVVTGDSAITGYVVTSIPGLFTANAGPSDTSAVVTGLANGTAYTFTVKATNSNTTGSPSAASAAITPSTVPDAPTGVTLRNGDMYGSILVSWTAPFWNGGAAITNYTVVCISDNTVPSVTVGNNTYVNITGLNVVNTYTFAVYATNIKGSGVNSLPSILGYPSTDLVYTEWVKQPISLNTTATEQYPSIVTDPNGNSYIAYYSQGTVSGGTLLGSSDIVVTKLDRYGNIVWTIQSPVLNTTVLDDRPQIAIDSSSNIYISYVTAGSVSSGLFTGGTYDIVVTKLDSYGNIQWLKETRFYNTTGTDNSPFIAVDPSGNVYIAYQTTGTVSGGTYLGNTDIAVAKFNTNGDLLWVKEQPSFSTAFTESLGGCAVDSTGNVYVSYYTAAAISGGIQRGGNDIVVLKLNTNGDFQWAKQDQVLNTTSSEYSAHVATDASGNVLVTYITPAAVSGGIFLGTYDICVAKLDPITGNLIWLKELANMNTTGNEDRPRVVCDSSNNIYVTYHIGSTPSGGIFVGGSYDIAVSKLDTNGNLIWMKSNVIMNTTGTDDYPTIGVDMYGGVYVSYWTQGAVSGGTFLGSYDIVIAKLSQFVLGAPAAPSSVVLSPGNLKATLSWAPLTTSYVYPITSYTLTANPGNLTTTVGGTATSATISGLSGNGTNYTFDLYATNSQGNSSTVTRSANIYTLSAAPTSVVGNSGNGQAIISWIPPTEGELPITSYTVTASPSGQSTTTINGTTYRAIVSGLTNGYSYTFRVVANTSGGSSDPSAASNVVIPSTIPTAPTNVVAVPGELYGSMSVTWQPMSNGGSAITSYRITASPGNITMTASAGATRVIFNGLDAATAYTFTIAAINVNGTSSASSPSIAAYPASDLFYLDWIKELGITNTTGTDAQPTIVADNSGNVFIAYGVSGTISGGTYIGGYDVAIAKYNTYGSLQWLKQYPALNTVQSENLGFHMAIDTTGNIYLTYTTSGIVSGGTNIGSNDVVLTKLDTNGTIQWIRQQNTFNSTGAEYYSSACVDISGNVYLSYYTSGIVSGGTSGYYLVVVKFNSSGVQQWIKQTASIGTFGQYSYDPKITVDALGNLYIIYHSLGTISGGTFTGGTYDMVILKMDTNGNTIWTRQNAIFNTTGTDQMGHIVTDRTSSVGDIYITYTTSGTVSGGTLRGSNDVVIGKMDTNGNVVWLKQYPQINTTGAEQSSRIVMDSSSNVYVTYQVNGTVSGGTAIGGVDIAVAKLNSSGDLVWVKQQELMNSNQGDVNPYLAIDASGNIYVAYQSSGTVSGGTYLGNQDVALFKMSQHVLSAPPNHTVTVTPGNLQAVVSWTPPPTVLINPITQYVITSNRGHNIVVNGQTFSTTITNLSGNGTSYTFTVAATNSIGTTSVSANAALIYKLPDAPVLSGVGSNTQVTMGWSIPAAGDSPITSYTLSWTSTSGNGTLTINDPTSTSATIGSLVNGTVYAFSIVANTAVGVGNTGTASATPSTLPGIPTVIAYPGRKYSELLLDITCNNGGASIINYTITASPGNRIYTVSGTTRYAPIANLDPNTAYSFTVVAKNVNGSSSASTATAAMNPSSDLYYLDWIKQYPSMNTSLTEQYPNCALDANGNLYIAYWTYGTISGGTNKGSGDIAVAKLNSSGNIVWARQQLAMNTTSDDQWPRLTADPSGNVYVSYQTTGIVSGGTNLASTDIVIFKMDTNGNLQWIKQNTSMNTISTDSATSLGVDASGNLYASYSTSGTISSGLSTGLNDIVLLKMSAANGNISWVRQFALLNTSSSEYTPRMVVDTSGNSYIAYQSYGTISSGSYKGNGDIVVVKVDTNANVIWTREQLNMNTSGTDSEPSIALDPSGNLYVTYYGAGTASGGTLIGGSDCITFKMDNDGALQWVKQYAAVNTGGTEFYPFISVDASGNSYITYYTFGTVSGGLALGGGASDIVVHKLDTNGNLMWVKQQDVINTGNQDQRPIIAVMPDGTLYVTYYTFGAVSGGQNTGFWDIVVFKMSQHTTAVPGIPTNLIVSGGNAQATLSWTAPQNNNSLLTGYTITSSPGGIVTTVSGDATSALITGLINNVSYTFTIYATNGVGNSSTATSPSVKPTGGLTAPDAPTDVFAAADYGFATVSWTAPLNDGGSAITGYTVICTPAANGFKTVNVGGSTYIATVEDLVNGVVYTFTVKATNAIGTSVASAATTASYVDPVISMAIQSASGDSTALTSYIETAVLTKTLQEVYLEIRNSVKNTQLSTADQANVMNIVIKELTAVNGNQTIFIVPNDEMPLLFSSASTTATILLPRAAQVILPEYNTSGLASYSLVNNPVVLDGTQYLQFEIPPSYALTVSNMTGSATLSFNGETISDGTNQYSAGDRITIGSHTYIVSAIGSITLLPLSQNKMVMMANNNGILKTQGGLSILAVSTL